MVVRERVARSVAHSLSPSRSSRSDSSAVTGYGHSMDRLRSQACSVDALAERLPMLMNAKSERAELRAELDSN